MPIGALSTPQDRIRRPLIKAQTMEPNWTDSEKVKVRPNAGRSMRRATLPLVVGLLGALLIAGLARQMSDWEPTTASLRKVIRPGPLVIGDTRAEEFNRRLTRRYRERLLAVRVILHPPDRIEIRCGANIPRHMMARIAVQTEGDARALFGRPFDVDVYETYVAAPKRKVAEMRTSGRSGRARLIFDRYSDSGRKSIPDRNAPYARAHPAR